MDKEETTGENWLIREEWKKYVHGEMLKQDVKNAEYNILEWWLPKLKAIRDTSYQEGKDFAKKMAYNGWIPNAIKDAREEDVKWLKEQKEKDTIAIEELEEMPINEATIKELVSRACDVRQNSTIDQIIIHLENK